MAVASRSGESARPAASAGGQSSSPRAPPAAPPGARTAPRREGMAADRAGLPGGLDVLAQRAGGHARMIAAPRPGGAAPLTRPAPARGARPSARAPRRWPRSRGGASSGSSSASRKASSRASVQDGLVPVEVGHLEDGLAGLPGAEHLARARGCAGRPGRSRSRPGCGPWCASRSRASAPARRALGDEEAVAVRRARAPPARGAGGAGRARSARRAPRS